MKQTKQQQIPGQTMIPLTIPELTEVLRERLVRLIRLDWQDDAACTTSWQPVDDPFFPDTERDPAAEAKAICGACSVRVSCLSAALVREEEHGVWGGATPADRDRIRVGLALGDPIPIPVALSGGNLAATHKIHPGRDAVESRLRGAA